MPEQRSALASVYKPGRVGVYDGPAQVVLFERANRTLVQVSGWPGSFRELCRKLETLLACRMPEDGLKAISQGQRSIFRVGPERLWVAGPSDDDLLMRFDGAALGEEAVVTEIGHSRTIVRAAGAEARTLLNRGLPIDLDFTAFPVDAFAQSVIHHMPVLVHRVGDSDFDVYVARDYAVSFWEWLTGAARSLGCQISGPE
ncbi:MAG: hypothetical protein HY017_03940 [Betaproteobacteria bacterium]|nr:hypothetical protein [Betaproteobacteria bacterium]